MRTPSSALGRVKATSLNYANYIQMLGNYQEKPPLLLIPAAPITRAQSKRSVIKFVVPLPFGSFAQFIVADESKLFQVPEACDLVAAGALPVAFGTSNIALVHRAQLISGQVLLVLGAAGGVGTAAEQIVKAKKLKGVDVLYDPVGGKLTKESMKLLKWGAGEIPLIPANIALVKANLAFAAIKDWKVIGKVMVICKGPGSADLKFDTTMRQCRDEE